VVGSPAERKLEEGNTVEIKAKAVYFDFLNQKG
jgi:hypothetical protein